MITEIQEVKEYREDGSLRYECTMAWLSKESEQMYENRIINEQTGRCFIRINHATKYRKDGSIEWKLIYNDYGVPIHDGKQPIIRKNTFSENPIHSNSPD